MQAPFWLRHRTVFHAASYMLLCRSLCMIQPACTLNTCRHKMSGEAELITRAMRCKSYLLSSPTPPCMLYVMSRTRGVWSGFCNKRTSLHCLDVSSSSRRSNPNASSESQSPTKLAHFASIKIVRIVLSISIRPTELVRELEIRSADCSALGRSLARSVLEARTCFIPKGHLACTFPIPSSILLRVGPITYFFPASRGRLRLEFLEPKTPFWSKP